jgi:hypothetical protein
MKRKAGSLRRGGRQAKRKADRLRRGRQAGYEEEGRQTKKSKASTAMKRKAGRL